MSVVIPTYARPRFLRQAVDSVLGQTIRDFECIVVADGGGHPGPLPEDPRLRLLRRPNNGGPGAARNDGIDAAQGRYVAFLDDDDVWAPRRLEHAIARASDVTTTVCWVRYLDEDRPSPGRVIDGDVTASIAESFTPNVGQTMVMRSAVPRFRTDLRAVEDIEWWLRLARRGPVATVTSWDLSYRRHDGHRTGNGVRHRVEERRALLDGERHYFAAHPRAAAFQWRRIGDLARALGERRGAASALGKSIALHPTAAAVRSLAATVLWPRSGVDEGWGDASFVAGEVPAGRYSGSGRPGERA